MRRMRALLCGLALAVTSAGCARPAVAPASLPAGTAAVLLVADLHFDPFSNRALVGRLAATSPSGWDAVFATDVAARESGYETDTNAALLASSLAAMRAATPRPEVVAIAGDFLAHDFRRRYANSAPQPSEAGYERFMDATIAYLALAFDRAFPHARFLVTIGNNDGYCGDYESTPRSPFLAHMAAAWGPLVDRDGAAPGFRRDFSRDGTYAEALPFGTTRVLSINSVFWSRDYHDRCGRAGEDVAAEQQAELRARLAASPRDARWWVLTHVPPGVDTFASLRGLGLREMYHPADLARLLALRTPSGRAFDLVLAGHTHMNDFRLVAGAGGRGVAPVQLIPSITRFSGNDPGFLVLAVRRDGTVADVTAYHDSAAFAGIGPRGWSLEYDFDDAFGRRGLDAAALAAVQARLATDDDLRNRFYGQWYASGSLLGFVVRSTWHRTWCAQAETEPRRYLRCRGKD